jgi:hypothetical protein
MDLSKLQFYGRSSPTIGTRIMLRPVKPSGNIKRPHTMVRLPEAVAEAFGVTQGDTLVWARQGDTLVLTPDASGIKLNRPGRVLQIKLPVDLVTGDVECGHHVREEAGRKYLCIYLEDDAEDDEAEI